MEHSPYLIVGLGNPGPRYSRTRHNVGFLCLDMLTGAITAAPRERFDGEFSLSSAWGERVGLLRPMTFMNLSGRSVAAAANFYKVPRGRVIVIHDELDLPAGRVRLKLGGGDGGHRGIRSISECLGGKDYWRVRVGIGRPPGDFDGTVADFVLQAFAASEEVTLGSCLAAAKEAVQMLIQRGAQVAMNEINSKQ